MGGVTATTADIDGIVKEGFLAPEVLLGYRCALGQDVASQNTSR
jgi:hypothetical protein